LLILAQVLPFWTEGEMTSVLRDLIRCFVYRQRDVETDSPTRPTTLELRRLTRVMSDIDQRSSRSSSLSSTADDMHRLMRDEDERRETLFSTADHFRPPKSPRRLERHAGAHDGFRLAQKATSRVYCCGACGAWLVRPQDLVPTNKRVVDVSIDDCRHSLCAEAADVVESKEGHSVTSDNLWQFRVRPVHCASCKIFLGVKVKTAERTYNSRIATAGTEELYELLTEAHYESRGVRISAPEAHWLSHVRLEAEQRVAAARLPHSGGSAPPNDAAEPSSTATVARSELMLDWSEPRPVEQVFLGTRYLRLLEAHHQRPLQDVIPLLCVGCGSTLTYTDQLLCTKRRWGFGRSVPESACYVNSVVRGAVVVKEPYLEHLAQGLMEMADVYCSCGMQVGYKFVADKTSMGRNQNQVGRYGLVCSRINVASFQLSHSKLHGQE